MAFSPGFTVALIFSVNTIETKRIESFPGISPTQFGGRRLFLLGGKAMKIQAQRLLAAISFYMQKAAEQIEENEADLMAL